MRHGLTGILNNVSYDVCRHPHYEFMFDRDFFSRRPDNLFLFVLSFN